MFSKHKPHPNVSERGTKRVFPVNLAQIGSVVPEIFLRQTKKSQHQKQNLTQFTACYCSNNSNITTAYITSAAMLMTVFMRKIRLLKFTTKHENLKFSKTWLNVSPVYSRYCTKTYVSVTTFNFGQKMFLNKHPA